MNKVIKCKILEWLAVICLIIWLSVTVLVMLSHFGAISGKYEVSNFYVLLAVGGFLGMFFFGIWSVGESLWN